MGAVLEKVSPFTEKEVFLTTNIGSVLVTPECPSSGEVWNNSRSTDSSECDTEGYCSEFSSPEAEMRGREPSPTGLVTEPQVLVTALSSDDELEAYYKSRGMCSTDIQTDGVIVDPIPQKLIEFEDPHVMQICARISGVYIADALLDGCANCNVIRLSLLYDLARQGREVYFTPFQPGRFSTGIGGKQPILGKCTLSVAPGSSTPN
ncbi:hypothetical protein HDU67_005245, partial [Dinochytrium kinnereticum]